MSVVCCVCRALVAVVGSELEVDVLAFADALEVGLLVVGDVVVAEMSDKKGSYGPFGSFRVSANLCVGG